MKAPRSRWWLVLAAAPLMLCGGGWLCLTAWIPMEMGAFYISFVVENRTEQPVWVTPVGAPRGRTKPRCVLPLFVNVVPLIPSPRTADFEIPAGQSRRFLYDWDDVAFSEVLVRTIEGKRRELRVVTPPEQRPEEAHYEITDPASLPPASPEVLKAAEVRWGGVRGLLFYAIAVIFVALFVAAVVRARRGAGRRTGADVDCRSGGESHRP